MDIKGILEFFATTDIGRIILLILAASVAGSILLWRDSNRLRTMRLKLSAEQSERDDKLEQKRLDNEQRESDRRAVSDSEHRTTLNQLSALLGRVVTIQERMERQNSDAGELLKRISDIGEATAIKATNIHKDVRSGVVTLAGKLDNANSESRSRWETTQQITNNRSQEQIKAIHGVGDNIQTTLTTQNTILDQMLGKIMEVAGEVRGLRVDFKDNATTKHDDQRFATLEKSMGELIEGMVWLKKKLGTGELNPDVVKDMPSSVAAVVNTATFADPKIGSVPKAKTGPLPTITKQTDQLTEPPPTIIPAAPVDMSRPVGTFATPTTTSNVETQKLDTAQIRAANDAQHVPTTKPEGRHDAQ